MSPPPSPAPEQSAPVDPRVARSRRRVLDAATELLVSGGPSDVTVDAVVARSGVAKTTIYRHWASRDDLLVDLLGHLAPTVPEPDPSLGTRDALLVIVRAAVAGVREPRTATAIPSMIALKQQLGDVADLEARMHGRELEVLAEVLRRGARAGDLRRNLDPARAAALLFGPLLFAQLTDIGAVDDALAVAAVDAYLAANAPVRR